VDLFSLGVVMWETFARKRLFRGDSAAEQLHQVLESQVEPLDRVVPGFPSPISEIVMHALSRDPNQRIASGNELAEQLRGVAQMLPAGADPSLRRWLERRVSTRLDERRQQAHQIVNGELTPTGPQLASDGVPRLSRPSISVPTQSMRSGATPLPSGATPIPRNSGFTSVPSAGSASSVRLANGELTPSAPQPPETRRRFAIVASLLVATVLAIGGWVALRREQPATVQPASQPAPPEAQLAPPMPAADPHKVAGLAAMQAKDYATAITEFATALRAKSDPELVQLMQLARKLQQDAARRK
jgi:serine/threonine-protein kinase